MSGFEVLKRCGASEIECVLPNASVSGERTLAACDVGESVLDGYALTQSFTAARRCDEVPKALLERFVGGNADLASAVGGLLPSGPNDGHQGSLSDGRRGWRRGPSARRWQVASARRWPSALCTVCSETPKGTAMEPWLLHGDDGIG
jgi:hypothetical protein